MGSFFTNIQFCAGDRAPADARAAVISAIRERWLEDGSMEEASADQPAEVVVAVGPEGDEPWIAVYDHAAEDQDQELLAELATRVSAATSMSAVSITVHDSDLLYLQLFDKGKHRDTFVNRPDYFGEDLSERQRKSVAGKPRVWATVFPWVKAARLKAAWGADDTFADATLERLSGLLKWNPQLVAVGFDTLEELPPARFTWLRFRVRPEFADRSLPRLYLGGMMSSEGWAGGSLTTLTSVWNRGGRSRGLDIVLWGPALDDGLVRFDVAEIWIEGKNPYGPRAGKPPTAQFKRVKAVTGESLLVARFDDFAIPAVTPGRAAIDRMWDFEVVVRGVGLKTGKGGIFLGLVPITHREGEGSVTIDVVVKPPPP